MGGSVFDAIGLAYARADTTGARDHLELVSWLSWFGDYLRLGACRRLRRAQVGCGFAVDGW